MFAATTRAETRTQLSLLTLGILLFATGLRAEVVTLSPVADTSFFEAPSGNNMGGLTTLVSGGTAGEVVHPGQPSVRGRALIRFNLAGQIPSGVTVTSVTFTIQVVKVPFVGGVNSAFNLHRVLRPWGEGNKGSGLDIGTGQPASDGEATWNARFHPATLWSAPGAQAGTDYVSSPSGSKLIAGIAGYTFDSAPGLVADVQSWLDETNSNHGWFLISESESTPTTARRFGSREAGTNAPALVVGYTTIVTPPAPLMSQMTVTGNRVTFQFDAVALAPYTVQFIELLSTTNWLVLTNVPPQSSNSVSIIGDGVSTGHRFYRVTSP